MRQATSTEAPARAARRARVQARPARGQMDDRLFALLLVLPTLIAVLAVTIFPFGYSAWMSLHQLNMFSQDWVFVGLDNYLTVTHDLEFRSAFFRTLYFAFVSVVGGTLLGLAMALVLNERFKGRALLRSAILIPWAMSGVVVGYLWGWIFNGQYGTINGILYALGLIDSYIPFLADGFAALNIVALVYIWSQAPLAALLFLAALQTVPASLYNAAKIDGASAIQRFLRITLPWLRSMLLLVLILATINALLAFDLFWVMTKGGPGSDTTVFSWLGYAYAFLFTKYGEGTATLYILSILSLLLAAVYLRLLQQRGTRRSPAAEAAPASPATAAPATAPLDDAAASVSALSVARLAQRPRRARPPFHARSRLSGQRGERLRTVGLYVCVVLIAIWTLLPFAWLIGYSFSYTADLLGRPPAFAPIPPTLENFHNVIFGERASGATGFGGQVSAQKVPLGIRNSFIVSTVVTAVNLVIGGLAGYAFARYQRFGFMNASLWALMMTRMIPGLAIAIPFFMLFKTLGLTDSLLGLVIAYTSFILPLTVWTLKGYFDTIPPSLERAAYVDGCSRLQTLWRIVVPVARPGLVAAGIFCFLVAWNEFVFALILTGTPNAQTIPVVISGFTVQVRSNQYGSIFASGTLAVLPPVLTALLFQRYLVSGLLSGSTKG